MLNLIGAWRALDERVREIGEALVWLPPLLARAIVGTVFVQSGWGKLHSLDNVIAFFRELGIPWPEVQAPFAATNEFICGALVLLGLATRFAAVPLIVVMVVAIKTAIWPNLETVSGILNASEFLYIALLVWLGINGPGAVSVDAALSTLLGAGSEVAPSRQPLPS